MTTKDLRKIVNRKLHTYESARERVGIETAALDAAKAKQVHLRVAISMAQEVAQIVQAEAHRKIADVVSRSLETVFGEDAYVFKINFEQKRGRTEAVLVFERNGMEVDPMTAAGGGVVDLASFALRLSCLMLARPPLRRLLVLDEPLKFISKDYRPMVRTLVEQLASELGIQVILITHSEEFIMGKVIELGD